MKHPSNLGAEAVLCHRSPFSKHIYALFLQVLIARVIGLVRGLWFLLRCGYWGLTGTLLVILLLPRVVEMLQLWVCAVRCSSGS